MSDFSSCEEEPYSAGSSDDYVRESNSESEYVFDQGVLDDEYESEPDIDICEPEEIPLNEAQSSQPNSDEKNRILDWVLPTD